MLDILLQSSWKPEARRAFPRHQLLHPFHLHSRLSLSTGDTIPSIVCRSLQLPAVISMIPQVLLMLPEVKDKH